MFFNLFFFLPPFLPPPPPAFPVQELSHHKYALRLGNQSTSKIIIRHLQYSDREIKERSNKRARETRVQKQKHTVFEREREKRVRLFAVFFISDRGITNSPSLFLFLFLFPSRCPPQGSPMASAPCSRRGTATTRAWKRRCTRTSTRASSSRRSSRRRWGRTVSAKEEEEEERRSRMVFSGSLQIVESVRCCSFSCF